MLTTCLDCQTKISSLAPACPYCGRPLRVTTAKVTDAAYLEAGALKDDLGAASAAAAKLGITRQAVSEWRKRYTAGPTRAALKRARAEVKIRSLAARKHTVPEIADAVGLSRSSVREFCLRHKIEVRPGVAGRPKKE